MPPHSYLRQTHNSSSIAACQWFCRLRGSNDHFLTELFLCRNSPALRNYRTVLITLYVILCSPAWHVQYRASFIIIIKKQRLRNPSLNCTSKLQITSNTWKYYVLAGIRKMLRRQQEVKDLGNNSTAAESFYIKTAIKSAEPNKTID